MENSRRSFLQQVTVWVAGVLAIACGSDPTAEPADGGKEPAPKPEPTVGRPTATPTASAAPNGAVQEREAPRQEETSESSAVDETEEPAEDSSDESGVPDNSEVSQAQVVTLRVLGPDGRVLAEGELAAQPELTPLQALAVTQLSFQVTADGYVERIDTYGASGVSGWHYRVGGCHPGKPAGEYRLGSVRRVDWEYVAQDAGCLPQ